MKFKFSLETVLMARDTEESFQRSLLAKLNTEFAKLKELERDIEDRLSDDRGLVDTTLPVTAYRRIHAEKMQLIRALGPVRAKQKKLEQQIQDQNKKVVESARAKKVLEKLKDKKYEEFIKTQDEAEQKMMNELGILGYYYQN
jgi:flagellar FliJ protein